MKKPIKNILEKIEEFGFEAFIVGGYVRDTLLGIDTYDIDICTNALPKDLMDIFDNYNIDFSCYGAFKIYVGKYNIDITTYRKEAMYNNRRPESIIYINNLEEDLLRRDFTINALCMDKDGNIIDLIGGIKDLRNRKIKCIGDINKKLKEDPLRILRAVRFAITLDFSLDSNLVKEIKNSKKLIESLSKTRRKSELDRILTSKYAYKGLRLLKDLELTKYMGIDFDDDIVITNDLCGMYSQISFREEYPFTKEEKNNIKIIKYIVSYGNIDNYILYRFGPYFGMVAGEILGLDKQDVNTMYQNLPIHTRHDINISGEEIMKLYHIKPCSIINRVVRILEKEILLGNLVNDKDIIIDYLLANEKRFKDEK